MMKHRFKVDLSLQSIDSQLLDNQKWCDMQGRNYEASFQNRTLK